MYPANLEVIAWEVIDFRDIISNIKKLDFRPVPLPPSFKTFNVIETKITKGSSQNEHSNQPSRKNDRKSKDPKFKINQHLADGDPKTPKS